MNGIKQLIVTILVASSSQKYYLNSEFDVANFIVLSNSLFLNRVRQAKEIDYDFLVRSRKIL